MGGETRRRYKFGWVGREGRIWEDLEAVNSEYDQNSQGKIFKQLKKNTKMEKNEINKIQISFF